MRSPTSRSTQVEVQADGSSIHTSSTGVPRASTLVISGTDLNNDGFICDPAEACGAYPVENAPETIVVGRSRHGVDFLVAYRIGVPSASGSKSTSKDVRPVQRRRRIMR